MAAKRLALFLGASILSSFACAADEQECAPGDLAPVDAWLARHPWKVGRTSPDARITAACKRWPADRNLLIVAAAYLQGEDDKNEIVALVDRKAGAVRATYTGEIAEDTITRVGSFRIDTARYDLAPGVRAFGVDFSSAGRPSGAAEFVSSGPERTLFVRRGEILEPVLVGISLTTWQAVPARGPQGELSHYTLAIGKTRSHGLADLIITRTTEPDEDGTPAVSERALWRFDGKRYGDAGPGVSTPLDPRPAASAPARP